MTASYEFSSKPRPVKTRPKFRQDVVVGTSGNGNGNGSNAETRQDPFFPVNIHHDPRVARGNTFAGDKRSDGPPGVSWVTAVILLQFCYARMIREFHAL